MKQTKLSPLMAIAISAQMIISPVVVHAQSATDLIGGVLQGLNSGVQNAQMAGAGGLSPEDKMGLEYNQRQSLKDKYFNLDLLMKLPGLGAYLSRNGINSARLNCATLMTTMHKAKNEACTMGLSTTNGIPPQIQMTEMKAYGRAYDQISADYSAYLTKSNVGGQAFGIGCMKDAMQILNGYFKSRVDDLSALAAKIEKANNDFVNASKVDLNGIAEDTALLDGGDSELVSEVRTNRPDLFDFAKQFNNEACVSMFPGDNFNQMGKEAGLNNISKTLKSRYSEKQGKYSGDSYSAAHASVITDINNMAENVAKQVTLNFNGLANGSYNDFLKGLSVSSNTGVSNALTGDLFSDIQTRFAEQNAKLNARKTTVVNETGLAGSIVSRMGDPNVNLDVDIQNMEKTIKNSCLTSTTRSNMDQILSRIQDPNRSNHANQGAAAPIKSEIATIMGNSATDLKQKLDALRALEKKYGTRYVVKMDSSYEVQELNASGQIVNRTVPASVRKTPSSYFADLINNCEAQFKVNAIGGKMSGSEVIQELKNLQRDYKTLANNHANEMKGEIRRKMIDCGGDAAKANTQGAGSCEPSLFNTSSPGFCANAAISCSQKMKSCSEQAAKMADRTRMFRAGRVQAYKANMENNKKNIVAMFDRYMGEMMAQGEMLRAAFGVGFNAPEGIQREVPEGERYLEKFRAATSGGPDGSLLLEDPSKYVAMFKENVTKLKASIEEQQNQILGGGSESSEGLLAQHMKQTEENIKAVAAEAQTYAKACLDKFNAADSMMAAESKRQQEEFTKFQKETGEKRAQFCAKYAHAQENPLAACKESITDTLKVVRTLPGGLEPANKYQSVCDQYNNEGNKLTDSNPLILCQRIKEAQSDNKAELIKTCDLYTKFASSKATEEEKKEHCEIITTPAKDGKPETIRLSCDTVITRLKENIINSYGLIYNNTSIKIDSNMPAFCAAGDNSNRDMMKSLGEMLVQPTQTAGAIAR